MTLTYLQGRLTDIKYRLMIAKWESGGEGMNWDFEISRCKLIYRMDKQQGLTG